LRDLVIFAVFVVILPMSFTRPWVGLCAFSWLAYNRTQDLTWGFARDLPISQLIAIAMILGWLTMEFHPIRLRTPMMKAMVLMLLWVLVSMFATGLNWDLQGRRITDLAKVILVCLLSGAMLTSRHRLRVLMAIIALGLGFYSAKNGIMYALGSKSIAGPGGMLKDNNDFALAMVMNVPLLYYLADEMKPLKYGGFICKYMKMALCLSFLTIMSTDSRGGFLALGVAMVMIALKTRYKFPAIASMVLVGVVGLAAAPEGYRERIVTIFAGSSEMDESVQGRLTSWQVAGNMIGSNPLMGIGMNKMVKEYNNYTEGIVNAQGTTDHFARVAHNSYLQIWAESGTPAYILFMFMLVGTIVFLEVKGRQYKRSGDDWIVPYCNAIEVSLTSFMIGAAFLNRAHFDLIYQFVVIAGALPVVVLIERNSTAGQRRRAGPRIAQEVWVRHSDPFSRIGSR
jgi:probable O-glycosylation ligase (exosortase A-associated)